MALKLHIHERCRNCGAIDGRNDGAVIWRNLHRCPKAAPGPSSPPQDFPASRVVWVPAPDTQSKALPWPEGHYE